MEALFIDHGDYIELIKPVGGIKMIAELGDDCIWEVAECCAKNCKAGGFSDWRLPTREELKQLYQVRKICGIRQCYGTFWSSSDDECRDDGKWAVDFYEMAAYPNSYKSYIHTKHSVLFVR